MLTEAGGRGRPGRLRYVEAVLAVAVSACVLIVHDVPYLLRAPYWFDESWVAVSTRARVSELTTVTASSPIGWTFLLRLVPGSGQQDQRLVPLVFAGLTVFATYSFARTLRLLPVVTGLLAGGAALLVPAMLVRNDLKQYTADAFVMMVALALISRLEAAWSWFRLAVLCVALIAMAFVSHVTLFIAPVALFCLAVDRLVRRRWTDAAEVVAGAAVTGGALVAIFEIFDGGTQTPAVKAYWNAYYVPRSPSAAFHYINTKLRDVLLFFGVGHAVLLVVLVSLGVVVVAGQGRWATAAMLPVLSAELVVLSAMKKYPLLDERTSTFVITAALVLAAIGVAGIATYVASHVHLLAGIAVAAAAAAFYIPGTITYVAGHTIPYENVRAQAAYVDAHAGSEDVVLVSYGAGWGYGYYAKPAPQFASTSGTVGPEFSVTYPAADRILVLQDHQPTAVESGITSAMAMLSGHPGARLWIVINHVVRGESSAWSSGLAPLTPRTVEVAPGTSVEYVVDRG